MSTSLVMPRRLSRSSEDITALADTLRSRWKPAIGIEPWLRRNVRMLTRLVRDERWTWEDIGRALTEAGIVYETGRPWERRMLTVKVSEARRAIREQQEKQARLPPPPPLAPAPQPASWQRSHQAEEAPRRRSFRTVTLAGDTQAAPPKPAEPAKEPASAPAAKQDADAVYRQLFGNRKD